MAVQYATIETVEEMYDLDFLLRFASLKGDSQHIDVDKFERNLLSSSGRIDSYISRRYNLPLSTVPDHLAEKCVDIAIYRMCSTANQLTEIIKNRYEDAIEHLEQIASGKSGLGISIDQNEVSANGKNADQTARASFFVAKLVRD
ncbi:MAG: DUF1320 domain-containing protein [Desulfocapsa sp.]|nr:MAG: DUF1320 domain-containing protein [Desulfocapsa sp.]